MKFTQPSEATNAFHNSEMIGKNMVETLTWVVDKFDACLDHREISLLLAKDEIRKGLLKLKVGKSVRIRILTEINKENVSEIKKIMPSAEIRHLDNIGSNFVVADGRQYLGYAFSSIVQPHGISTNTKVIVDAHQFLFEFLWNASIPAEIRVGQLERNLPVEKTEILYGQENIVKHFLNDLKYAQESFDSCTDFTGPSLFVDSPIWSDYAELPKRGIRLRFITEINRENMMYCEKLLKVCELRHLEKVKGNFGIIDGRSYGAGSSAEVGQAPAQLIRSNIRAFVEQQQYFFETLWSKALPAERRIEQIQRGTDEEFIDTIKDPHELQKLTYELIKSSRVEIMIVCATSNAFLRQVRAGSFKLLEQAAADNGVNIRILSPSNKKILSFAQRYDKNTLKFHDQIKVRHLKEDLQTKISLLLVDKKYSLAVELKDDTKGRTVDAIGLGTYSNSKSTVLSYASIFETLWRQSELYERLEELNEELRLRDAAQREFINTAAHELRTPIQPILGLSEIILKSNKDEDLREYLIIIARNAERLHRLTNNILDVTRIEGRILRLDKGMVDLDNLISSLVTEYQTSIEQNKIGKVRNKDDESVNKEDKNLFSQVYYRPSADVGPVMIELDRDRIIQVLSNLVNNALNSSNKRRIIGNNEVFPIEIFMKKDDSSEEITIRVRDGGTGIDKSMNGKLFTKFVTTTDGGTGLGLYLSKNLVEAHGGKIWAYNNSNGRGATFCFTLPLKTVPRGLSSER
jgi:two-component system, OmpR family, sensor histidine kinase VicK